MTVRQAATLLGITPGRLRQMISAGQVRATKKRWPEFNVWMWDLSTAEVKRLAARRAGRPAN